MMAGKILILASAAALALLLILFAAEAWFCAAAFHAALGGCLTLTVENFAASPARIFALGAGAAGLLVGARMRGRK